MSSSPWMPFYVGDYIKDTMRLSTLEHGAYLLLIMEYWVNGELPTSDDQLARIARLTDAEWRRVKKSIEPLFKLGAWRHKRIEGELEKASDKSEKAKANGSRGAYAKWGDDTASASAKRSKRLAAARALARHSKEEWEALLTFCGRKCVECGSAHMIVKDHIKPIYAGGSDGIENLQPLCISCNGSKGPDATDYRPDGWRLAVSASGKTPDRTPSERLANAWLSQPQLEREERAIQGKNSISQDRGSLRPAGGDRG